MNMGFRQFRQVLKETITLGLVDMLSFGVPPYRGSMKRGIGICNLMRRPLAVIKNTMVFPSAASKTKNRFYV